MDDDGSDPAESGTEQFAWENGAFLIQLVCLASALVMGLVMVLASLALMVLLRHHLRRRQFLVWQPLHQPLSHYWGSRT